jgi:hypothetical protein
MQLSALFPLLKDPVFAQLGPQVNDTISDDDYLSIDPEGDIISQTGGTVSGGAVTFRIPLLRLLVLDKPLDYSVTFK